MQKLFQFRKKKMVLRIFKMTANTISVLNRDLSSNFFGQESANHVKFTQECMLSTGKHVLQKKKHLQMG